MAHAALRRRHPAGAAAVFPQVPPRRHVGARSAHPPKKYSNSSIQEQDTLAFQKSVTLVSHWEAEDTAGPSAEEVTFTGQDLSSCIVPVCGVLLIRKEGER